MSMFHIVNVGGLIEKNEDTLRSEINDVYINKQRQITNTGRLKDSEQSEAQRAQFYKELAEVQAAQNNATFKTTKY